LLLLLDQMLFPYTSLYTALTLLMSEREAGSLLTLRIFSKIHWKWCSEVWTLLHIQGDSSRGARFLQQFIFLNCFVVDLSCVRPNLWELVVEAKPGWKKWKALY